MGSSSCLYTLELLHVLRHGHFGRQPLHARGTEKPYDAIGLLQDVCRVLGRGDWPSVAEHENVRVLFPGRVVHSLYALDSLIEAERRPGADGARGCETHVRD